MKVTVSAENLMKGSMMGCARRDVHDIKEIISRIIFRAIFKKKIQLKNYYVF